MSLSDGQAGGYHESRVSVSPLPPGHDFAMPSLIHFIVFATMWPQWDCMRATSHAMFLACADDKAATKDAVRRALWRATMNRTILCYAHGRDGDWEAICLDFDIAVQGQSFEEVKSLLEQSIHAYIVTAAQEEPAVRKELLSRRAPLWTRISIAATFLWHAIRLRNRGDDSTAGFSMPCPV